MRFDFSQFHPCDHWPFTARCRRLPGGPVRHLRLAWTFHRRDQVLRPVYRLLRCPFGRHRVDVWYSGDGRLVMPACRYCDYRRLPSEAEIDGRRDFPRWLIGDDE